MKPKLARRDEPRYFIRQSGAGKEEGPFTIEALRERARSGTLSRETWFRPADGGEFRPLGEDGPMVADLWPDEGPFEPEQVSSGAGGESQRADVAGADWGRSPADVSELLRENVERDRAARATGDETIPAFDWRRSLPVIIAVVRWVVAVSLVVAGALVWVKGDDTSYNFVFTFIQGMVLIVVAIALTLPETLRLFMAPITGFFDTLLQGSGGGTKADYWTADKLMEQGEFRLALAEYRKIVHQHPRELEAYLKGIRAARAMDDRQGEERLRELAMKNLTSEQDRNLFLASLDRM